LLLLLLLLLLHTHETVTAVVYAESLEDAPSLFSGLIFVVCLDFDVITV
jgi:hypothetical protein